MHDATYQIQPFCFLDHAGRQKLTASLTTQRFGPGETVIEAGSSDRRVFLLLAGRIDATNSRGKRVGLIDSGHYFGERAALFDLPRRLNLHAVEEVVVDAFPGDILLELLREQPAFAQGLGAALRQKQGIFVPFERFLAELQHGATQGHIVLPKLLHRYYPLVSALHRGCNDEAIDFGALGYAVARLPKNIGSTLQLLLTEEVPYLYQDPNGIFEVIETPARRRSVWEIMPGKSLVLLRDGWSDLVDLVSCLCIYTVEARKIRRRMRDTALYTALRAGGEDVMDQLPFSNDELASLRALWPDLRPRLLALSNHHEDIAIAVYKSVNNYNSAHSELWTDQLLDATHRLTGSDPRELPDDYEVHIISSNTHSVGNCLSSWLNEHTGDIVAWGYEHRPATANQPWASDSDRVIALVRDYFKAHPQAAAEKAEQDAGDGVITLTDTAQTGIGVQLLDLQQLVDRNYDQTLPDPDPRRNGMILNIDYAFGQQAEHIVGALVVLFGKRIRSVNILGKAGGLEGNRGDIFVATSFIEQEDDGLHVPDIDVDVERLKARIPDRGVRVGPVLTVLGTVMQNQVMLNFYRRIWGCVGLEMEGSYYCRQLIESLTRGVLRDDVQLRFLYYVSDLPLHVGETLSGSMRAMEGIPPLYAVTREVLTAILESEPETS